MGGAQKHRVQGGSSKPPPGGFDGPASQTSQSPSRHGNMPVMHPSGDPARDPVEKPKVTDINRRLDLPGMAYNLDRMVSPILAFYQHGCSCFLSVSFVHALLLLSLLRSFFPTSVCWHACCLLLFVVCPLEFATS